MGLSEFPMVKIVIFAQTIRLLVSVDHDHVYIILQL